LSPPRLAVVESRPDAAQESDGEMPMKTRAAILTRMGAPAPYATSRPLEVADVELDPPGPGEVLLRMRAAGLCHSDLSVIDGNRPRPLPMVLGHEGAGVVEALGAGVSDLRVGDHVVTAFVPSCGQCGPCADHRPALCEPGAASNTAGTLISGARRLHRGEAALNHHLGVSAFAQYATVSRNSVVAVDRELPFAEAAVFGCAVITGVGAVVNTAGLTPGRSVAVIGLGGVGLAAVLGARAMQAHTIVAVDLSEPKLALARELGATHVFNAADADCAERIREATRGGVDAAFEMAGSVRAMELAYRVTRRGGQTVTAGLSHPQAMFTIPHVQLVAEERTIRGSYLGSCVPSRDIPRYVEWYRAGRLPVDRLLSGTIPLEEINAGFDSLARGETVRTVVEL
jgi:alcohol dehydrogenase